MERAKALLLPRILVPAVARPPSAARSGSLSSSRHLSPALQYVLSPELVAGVCGLRIGVWGSSAMGFSTEGWRQRGESSGLRTF